jgi:putative SOS response-associated peptidase YedK
VPHWSNEANPMHKPINARGETVDRLPTFRESFRTRRCLLVASGFYEWRKAAKGPKQATHFRFKDRRVFGFAGLWDVWKGDGPPLATCCLITTAANDVVRPVHDRMPVMLTGADFSTWLAPETPLDLLRTMLAPAPPDEMEGVAVGPLVNSPRNEGPELIEPV